METELARFGALGTALAIGLLVGVERGWGQRDVEEGERVAGVRTYGLLGLLGGTAALLARDIDPLLGSVIFLGVAGVLITAWAVTVRAGEDVGVTSLVAAMLTFALGALAGSGRVVLASSAAVITTLLLAYKPVLHRWVYALDWQELKAVVKLLLITVVVLPVLPDRGFGPWNTLNPFEIWWMVVLIAGISFAGYVAMRLGGARRGMLFTGVFGGLASSTAATLHFLRQAREAQSPRPRLTALGVLLANAVMPPRVLLLAAVVDPGLVGATWQPLLLMAAVLCLPVAFMLRASQGTAGEPEVPVRNPLALGTALGFGAVLALTLLAASAVRRLLGDAGVIGLAAVAGIANLDAITLSLARLAGDELAPDVAALGLVLAVAVNQLVKGIAVVALGGTGLAARVAVPLALSAVAGPLGLWWWSGTR